QEGNFKQTLKLCMPFLMFKKDEFMQFGVQTLDLKLPFREIEVLKEFSKLIKRQIGLEHVEVLSAANPDAAIKAGPYAYLLRESPPTPGSPTCIFLTKKGTIVTALRFPLGIFVSLGFGVTRVCGHTSSFIPPAY
nr:leucine--tRNA ligase, cytoplasmic [Tanacetum cinerariifolium]GFB60203.1 leucine--tRNA ligase, cytoplasmic [Tanacetum cinerariifolium]